MSILVKPYEISVWDDIWDSTADSGKGKFIEKRLGIIGSNKMTYQGYVRECGQTMFVVVVQEE